MGWGDMGLLALKNALRARQKTFLCALAVCVGIASVYMICEISRNARDQITQQVEQSGLSGIMVFGKEEQGMMAVEEIRALPQSVPGLKAAMPLFSQYGSCRLRENKRNMLLWGVDEQFSSIFHVQVKYGRLPSQEDVRLCQKVAVIEDTMALEAYGRENVVGKEIWISTDQLTESYQIIGVIGSQKSGVSALIGENTLPAFVYVPYTTANLFSGVSSTNQLALAAQDEADADAVTAFALDQLSRKTDGASFKAENVSGYIDTFSSILQTVSLLITAIGGIGLLVGGIGVMNSMTAAVESRRKEIGIYLAIGAQKKDIIGSYLMEAVIVCLLGGLGGGLLGWGLLFAAGKLLGISVQFHWEYLLLAESAAGFCGILFGILPARKAAAMHPIDAIRRE